MILRPTALPFLLQDPLLQMLDLQDLDGTLRAPRAPRGELRRMALMVGEKMLKATCSLVGAVDRRPSNGAFRMRDVELLNVE